MAKYLWITGMLIHFSAIRSSAQSEPIQTDRPDQTECPFLTPSRYLQLELGFLAERYKSKDGSYQHPSMLWRYGLNDRFEIRLITEWGTDKVNEKNISGLQPLTFGIKTILFSEQGALPNTAFIGHLTAPKLGSKEFHLSHVAPSFRFTMNHTLHPSVGLSYNLGAEWDGETPQPAYVYTLALGFSLTGSLGAFVEVFGSATEHAIPGNSLDCGLTWLFHPDFMMDLSGGIGLTDPVPEYFISFGGSFRLNTKGKK